MSPRITPFLWYNDQAEEAARHYLSIFKNSRIVSPMPGEDGPMAITVDLDGQQLILFNGGPHFTFTPAVSLFIRCETQAEVDELWEKLSAGGEKSQCGWVRDKFGFSWQIVPNVLGRLLEDPDREKADRVFQAMMKMTKLDIAELERAAQES